MTIIYNVIKSTCVMSRQDLKALGDEGWTLGGIAQTRESVMEYKASSNVRADLFYYHFWKELKE